MAFGGLLRHPEYHYRLGYGGWRKGGDKEQRSQHLARLLAYLSVATVVKKIPQGHYGIHRASNKPCSSTVSYPSAKAAESFAR